MPKDVARMSVYLSDRLSVGNLLKKVICHDLSLFVWHKWEERRSISGSRFDMAGGQYSAICCDHPKSAFKSLCWSCQLSILPVHSVHSHVLHLFKLFHSSWFFTGGLEPWNFMTFPLYWECHHPNWRSPSFFRGVGLNHQPDIYIYIYLSHYSPIKPYQTTILMSKAHFLLLQSPFFLLKSTWIPSSESPGRWALLLESQHTQLQRQVAGDLARSSFAKTSELLVSNCNWLVVSNMFYFPFHIWDVILPID